MQRRRGLIWLSTGLLLAILAGLLTFRVLTQATEAASQAQEIVTRPVVVAVQDIPMRTVINEAQVSIKEIPEEMIPSGAATAITDVVGKITRQDIAAGEVILTQRLVEPTVKGRDVALTMPEDKVIIALPASDLMSKTGFLKPGDKVDLLFSLPDQTGEGLITVDAMQNLEIEAMVTPPLLAPKGDSKSSLKPTTALTNEGVLFFAVSAQDALTIKYLRDSGAIMDIVLRAPTSEQMLNTKAVDFSYVSNRYQFPEQPEAGTTTQGNTSGQ
ncbi:MAG: Flp pilus assembly protein CpaB [Anaerolineae bacterium]|nr:Flp pilus assembly protein CpaB [Anaerolineae bacterium]